MNNPINGKRVVAQISTEALRVAVPFVATSDVRYYLCGIHIRSAGAEPGVFLEATDGKICIIARDAEGWCEANIIVRINKADLPHARRAKWLKVTEDGMAYFVVEKDLLTWASPMSRVIDARYPDLSSAIPGAENLAEGWHGSFDPNLLARLIEAAPTKSSNLGLQFFHHIDVEAAARGASPRMPDKRMAMVWLIDGKHFGAVMPLVLPDRDIAAVLASWRAATGAGVAAQVAGEVQA